MYGICINLDSQYTCVVKASRFRTVVLTHKRPLQQRDVQTAEPLVHVAS